MRSTWVQTCNRYRGMTLNGEVEMETTTDRDQFSVLIFLAEMKIDAQLFFSIFACHASHCYKKQVCVC